MPDDSTLLHALQGALTGLDPVRIAKREAFKRRRDWRGERWFERVEVRCADTGVREICLKYCRPSAETESLGRGWEREVAAYRFLESHPDVGAPRFWGSCGLPGGSFLVAMEFVPGRRLKRHRAVETWTGAAEWLGLVQGRLSLELAGSRNGSTALPRMDPAGLERWAERAFRPVVEGYPAYRARAEALLRRFASVATTLGAAPTTLVHGELYCTNVLVRVDGGDRPFCPFDWETASLGCGTLDLAYLGRTELDVSREALIDAYEGGWRASGAAPQPRGDLRRQQEAGLVCERVYFLWDAAENGRAPDEKIAKHLRLVDRHLQALDAASTVEVS